MNGVLTARRGIPLLVAVIAWLAAAGMDCSSTPTNPGPLTFSFDFTKGEQGWAPGVGPPTAADFVTDYRSLAAPLDSMGSALYLSGGGPLFLFEKRQVTGLPAGKAFSVSVDIEIATDVAGNPSCGGAGAPPGNSPLKAGVSRQDPSISPDPSNPSSFLFNVDVGSLGEFGGGGANGITLGTIGNTTGCTGDGPIPRVWQLKDFNPATPITLQADPGGSAWLLFGMSWDGFEGELEGYLVKFSATFTPQ